MMKHMLNYLDGYPLMLPSRYADKAACYTEVYLVSNIPLEEGNAIIRQLQAVEEDWAACR